MLRFYRETRMVVIDKGSFPTPLNRLWEYKSADNRMGGFKGSGLWPFNDLAVNVEKCIEEEDMGTQPSPISTLDASYGVVVTSPSRIILRQAIINAIAPSPSAETELALKNSKRKRKRVQASHGEVLTTEQVAKRLRLEAEERKNKKGRRNKPKEAPEAKKKLTFGEEDSASSDNEVEKSGDEDMDNTRCMICNRLWRDYKGSKNELWVICDICDGFCCPKCIPADTDLDNDFYCSNCTA